jgi:rubredoxin
MRLIAATVVASAMSTNANLPDEFPRDQFTLFAFCEACGHSAAIARERIPPGVSVQALPDRLRCGVCGVRQASIRVVYTGAGGFQYGGGDLPAGG